MVIKRVRLDPDFKYMGANSVDYPRRRWHKRFLNGTVPGCRCVLLVGISVGHFISPLETRRIVAAELRKGWRYGCELNE